MKVRLEATLVPDSNTENFHESAHETFTKVLNEQRAKAELDNDWAPRLYITKAGYGADGQFHWEADIQFGWKDSPAYEGFKLTGSVPTSSDESLFLHRRVNYSVKPSLIMGDKETHKMKIEFTRI